MATATREGWRINLSGDTWLDGPRDAAWWTGRPPQEAPGFAGGALRALPAFDASCSSKRDLLDYFDNGWSLTELLFSGLVGEEAFYRPPWHELRHPMVFYYTHPAAVFVNKLRLAGAVDGPVHEGFEQLFETGVDEMAWDDLTKNAMRWPSVRECQDYRREVHALVRQVIADGPEPSAGLDDVVLRAVLLGCEHERIHLETSSVLIRELPLDLVRRPGGWATLPELPAGPAKDPQLGTDFPATPFVPSPGGLVTLGKPREWPTFGWDNEYGQLEQRVRPFAATEGLVSNGDVFPFVASGAYTERRWWSDAGWSWRTFRNARWPTFWVSAGPAGLHEYRLRTVFTEVDMPWSCPAVVNAHEAHAYAAWRSAQDGVEVSYRLPTEAEHHLLREPEHGANGFDPAQRFSGHELSAAVGANLALAFGGESPVDAHPANSRGYRDVLGNVWEWCTDHFAALPGFQVDPLYEDFSTPCFDGEHDVILGGSFASAGDEASVFARFHFRPHFYQHAGFRLVRPSEPGRPPTSCQASPGPFAGSGRCCEPDGGGKAKYETSEVLAQYLLLHFGDAEMTHAGLPVPEEALFFPRRCAELLSQTAARLGCRTRRALDVGCAVGGSSFALAKAYEHVDAFDLSEVFVDTARRLQRDGRMDFLRSDEGDLSTELTAEVDPAVDRERVEFRRGDACALPPDLEPYDAVLGANLLCRLPSPRAFLGRLMGPRALIAPGGLLLLVSPFSWMEQFTPKGSWLGGFTEDEGERRVRGDEGLRRLLSDEYELLEERPFPLLIREHARKYEYIVPHACLWRRKG